MTSACGIIPGQAYTFEDAVLAGVIIESELNQNQEQQPVDYTLTSPVIQELTERRGLQASLFFPVEKDLFFNHYEGEVEIFVEEGQLVSRGDLLATLRYDVDQRYYIEYEAALAHMQRLEQEFSRERTRRRNEISRARGEQPREVVRLLEIELERVDFINSLTIAGLEEEIAVLKKTLGTEDIIAPYDGMVFSVFEGSSIEPDTTTHRMMTIVDTDEFLFRIIINITHSLEIHYSIMGYGDIVTLRERTASDDVVDDDEDSLSPSRLEFDARVVTDSWAAGQRQQITYLLKPTDPDGLINRILQLDDGNPIITLRNLRWSTSLEFVAAPKGITLPAATIHREHIYDSRHQIIDEQHYVFIYTDGKVEKRSINIGRTVDGYAQILTGIDEDAKVVVLR